MKKRQKPSSIRVRVLKKIRGSNSDVSTHCSQDLLVLPKLTQSKTRKIERTCV